MLTTDPSTVFSRSIGSVRGSFAAEGSCFIFAAGIDAIFGPRAELGLTVAAATDFTLSWVASSRVQISCDPLLLVSRAVFWIWKMAADLVWPMISFLLFHSLTGYQIVQ